MCWCRCGETQRRRSSTPWAALGEAWSRWRPTTSSTTTVSGWSSILWIENATLEDNIFWTFLLSWKSLGREVTATLGSNSKSLLGAGRQSGPVSLAGRQQSGTNWECIQHMSALMCRSCLQLNQGGVHLVQSQRNNVYESAAGSLWAAQTSQVVWQRSAVGQKYTWGGSLQF